MSKKKPEEFVKKEMLRKNLFRDFCQWKER